MRPIVSTVKTAAAVLGGVLVLLDCHRPRDDSSPAASATVGAPQGSVLKPDPVPPLSTSASTEDERNTMDVFRRAAASTVFVTQKRMVVDYFRGPLEVPSGSGSGFVWDKNGHVVTNYHVVKDAGALIVTLHDHKRFDATVVGVEPRKDIAVLKIVASANALTPIQVRSDDRDLAVGQKAIAIGNPFGLDQTLTTGVVSALGREVEGIGGVSIRDMVQTDAAINPGNSGGPLLDSSGYLIGMNTMIYSASGASAGIGFAVPVNTIARVVPQIVRTGRAEQVGLGIQIDPSQRLERRARVRGVIVLSVLPNTPAEKAGLKGVEQTFSGIKLGDVIVGIDDKRIDDYDDLYNTLDNYRPGDKVKVTVARNGKNVPVTLELVKLD